MTFFHKTLALGPNLIETYYELGRANWFMGDKAAAKQAWTDGFKANLTSDPGPRWFYTTSAVTSASASATGTSAGSATMTDGTGTAYPCKETGTGTTETRVPDTDMIAVTIYNPVVYSTQIATGSFVRCVWCNSRWEVEQVIRCPGT